MKEGDKVIDKNTNKIETIIKVTKTSVLVTRTKLTDKGINCDNWFTMEDFIKKFTLL